MPRRLLATMFTTTTYGTWPPGDLRGYVDDGKILPGDPAVLENARRRMLGEPVYLTAEEQAIAFDALCAACMEFRYYLLAVSIESWHAHLLIDHGYDKCEDAIGRLKTRMRQGITSIRGSGRIWTEGYDERYCFDAPGITRRSAYIQRHHGNRPVAPAPH